MTVELDALNVDALKDLGRVQKVAGHNDMTRDELLDALDGPVEENLAKWLGKSRQEIYEAAGEAGIEDRKSKQKWELLEALTKTS